MTDSRHRARLRLLCAGLLAASVLAGAAEARPRWTEAQANAWYGR